MTNSTESVAAAASTKVVRRVAAVTDREVIQLPPLYETIDPEALDAIVDSVSTDASSLVCRFTYEECRITVDGSGAVSVEEL